MMLQNWIKDQVALWPLSLRLVGGLRTCQWTAMQARLWRHCRPRALHAACWNVQRCLSQGRDAISAARAAEAASALSRKRVFGIAAHIDAGKTTTCEAILYASGTLNRQRMGRVDSGDTALDFLPAERERGITISAASATFTWAGHRIFLVDSPGHLDFTFEVERALRVMDAVVVLIDAVAGVQPQTETVWRQADRSGLPRLLVVNKMDRDGARLHAVLQEARAHFGVRAPLLQFPLTAPDGRFVGVVDLITLRMRPGEEMADGVVFEAGEMDKARAAREELVEAIAEVDDEVMALWMEELPVPPDALRGAVRRACARHEIVPVLCAAALKDVGVREVMDAVVDYLPAPSERPAVSAKGGDGEIVLVESDVDAPFLAQAFKVTHDRHRGRLVHFRAFAGALEERKFPLWNCNKKEKERPSKWLHVLADEFVEMDRIECGDVFAMVGLRHTETGDTLTVHKPGQAVPSLILEGIDVPPAVCSVALETDSPSEQRELDAFLSKQLAEDPSLRLTVDENTGETLLSGVGELHLEAVSDRMKSELDIEVRISRPRVAYRESVTNAVTHDEHYDARIGSAHLTASLRVRVAPGDANSVHVAGDGWSREQRAALEEGVQAALNRGAICGFQTRAICAHVEPVDGGQGGGPDNTVALRACASQAIRAAIAAAGPVVLEPVMQVECTVPEAFSGDVTTELCHPNHCRGVVDDVTHVEYAGGGGTGLVNIKATVPLQGMMGWATKMRSICKGRGDFSMTFLNYKEVPEAVLEKIKLGW